MTKQITALTLASGLILLTSCEGDDILGGAAEAQKQLSESYLETEAAVSNIYNLAERVLRETDLQNGDSATVDGALVYQANDLVTIDFGTGIIGSDGLTRTGKLILSETGDYFTTGGQVALSFEQYTVNEKPVTGQLTVGNAGNNSLQLTATGFGVNGAFSLDAAKSITWKQGFDTKNDFDDDRFELSGTATGMDSTGNTVNTTIITPLSFDRQCEFGLVSGIIDLSFAVDTSSSTGSLDFISEDACDNLVKISIQQEGNTFNFTNQFSGF